MGWRRGGPEGGWAVGRRVLVFFVVYLFGFMLGLPALVLFFVQREVGAMQWPPPPPVITFDGAWAARNGVFADPVGLLAADRQAVDLRQVLPSADAAAAAVNADGTLAAAARFPTRAAADHGTAVLLAQYGVNRREPAPVGERIVARESMTGLLLRDDLRLLIVLGFQPGSAEARLARMPGLRGGVIVRQQKHATKDQLIVIGAGMFGWALLQFFLFGRVASWAATTEPEPGVAPVSAAVLRQRLLDLNHRDVPFTVAPGKRPNELVIDWRYADAKWFDLMRVAGLRRVFRLRIRLDEGPRAARAMDQWSAIDWSAGAGGAGLSFRTNFGITFYAVERGGVLGFQFKNGRLTLEPTYTWRFNLNHLRGPVAEVITSSGWRYKPVITFFRPIGG